MMIASSIRFAETTTPSSGIGAFNINLKSFIFQLVTFLIVLYIFKRWILPPILKTLEDRRKTVEQSLVHAKETEEILSKAEQKSQDTLLKAREQADKLLADANSQAKDAAAKAETAAEAQSQRIIAETENRLSQEREKLREELKLELADLVALATQTVLHRKLDEQEDRRLIEEAVKEVKV